ncbi:MAG TPA: hypothetical protein VHX44_06725 [Planctomycetota bacterium]|nr:hypothetical protein [Planctomycetota bacterium]
MTRSRSIGHRVGLCALLLVSAVAMGGCRIPFFSSRYEPVQREILSFHTTIEASQLHRVAVLPFHRADGIGRSAGAMDESMTSAMRELGLHEVLTVSVAERDLLLKRDVIRANRITTDELLALRDALKCDGVLIGRIEQFTSYDPLAIGVTADLVSCLDGSVVWSATGHFDGSRSDVQHEIENWYGRAISSGNIAGWKQTLESPKLFTRYVAERLSLSIPVPVAKK